MDKTDLRDGLTVLHAPGYAYEVHGDRQALHRLGRLIAEGGPRAHRILVSSRGPAHIVAIRVATTDTTRGSVMGDASDLVIRGPAAWLEDLGRRCQALARARPGARVTHTVDPDPREAAGADLVVVRVEDARR